MDDIIEHKMYTWKTVKVENIVLCRIRVYRADIYVPIGAILFGDLKIAYGSECCEIHPLALLSKNSIRVTTRVQVKNVINVFNKRG